MVRKQFVQCVVEAEGIPLEKRLGRAAEVPVEDLAFITDETLAQVIEPAALNSGNVVDIFQHREDDFEAIHPLEVTYRNPQGREVKETVFADSLALASSGPRICVCVSHVHAMHRAITVLSRKVDNLNMTLKSCREHYYKELISLRHGREADREHEKYWFSPKAYEDNVTKDLIRERLGAKDHRTDQELSQRDTEIRELRRQLSHLDELGQEKVNYVLTGTSLQDLFTLLVTKNQFRKVDFVRHMLRVGQELSEELNLDTEQASLDPYLGKAQLKQSLKAAELQASTLQEQLKEAEAANKSLMNLATAQRPATPSDAAQSRMNSAGTKVRTIAKRRGAIEAMKTLNLREIYDTDCDRTSLVPETRLHEMEKQAESWKKEAQTLSARLRGVEQDLDKSTSKGEKASKDLEKSRKLVLSLEKKLAQEITATRMSIAGAAGASATPDRNNSKIEEEVEQEEEAEPLSIEQAMQRAAEFAKMKGIRSNTLDHARQVEEAKRRAQEEADRKAAAAALLFRSAYDQRMEARAKRLQERRKRIEEEKAIADAKRSLEEKKGNLVVHSPARASSRRHASKEAQADKEDAKEEDGREKEEESRDDGKDDSGEADEDPATAEAAFEAALAQANDMNLSEDDHEEDEGDCHIVTGALMPSPTPTMDLSLKATAAADAANEAFALLREAKRYSAGRARGGETVECGTQTFVSFSDAEASWRALPYRGTVEEDDHFLRLLQARLLQWCMNFVNSEEPSVIKMQLAMAAVRRRMAQVVQAESAAKPRPTSTNGGPRPSRAVQRMKTLRYSVSKKMDDVDQERHLQLGLKQPSSPAAIASAGETREPTPCGAASLASRGSTPSAVGAASSRVPTPGVASPTGARRRQVSPEEEDGGEAWPGSPEGPGPLPVASLSLLQAMHQTNPGRTVSRTHASVSESLELYGDCEETIATDIDVPLMSPRMFADGVAASVESPEGPSATAGTSPSLESQEPRRPSHRSQMAKLAALSRPTAAGGLVRGRPRSSGRVAGQVGAQRWRPEVAHGGFTNRPTELILEGLPSNQGVRPCTPSNQAGDVRPSTPVRQPAPEARVLQPPSRHCSNLSSWPDDVSAADDDDDDDYE